MSPRKFLWFLFHLLNMQLNWNLDKPSNRKFLRKPRCIAILVINTAKNSNGLNSVK